MSSNMKDFTEFNLAFQDMAQSERAILANRALQASAAVQDAVANLPSDYARAYAGVITQEYDSSNHVIDVTDAKPRATVNYLISAAYSKFKTAVGIMETFKNQLEDLRSAFDPSTVDQDLSVVQKHLLPVIIGGTYTGTDGKWLILDLNSGELWIKTQAQAEALDLIPNSDFANIYSLDASTGARFAFSTFMKNGIVYTVSCTYSYNSGTGKLHCDIVCNYGWAGTVEFTNMTQLSWNGNLNGLQITGQVSVTGDYYGLVDPRSMERALDNLLVGN